MKEIQMSESLMIGVLLALSGGFMDAYSYLCRGEVFANAQTGNMLLFGVHLSAGEWSLALRYAFPVAAFAAGIVVSDWVRYEIKGSSRLHWRQITVLFEAVILLIVAFLSLKYNLLANSLTSFACGMQVESFRKVHGKGIATTMCIGNLRSAVEHMGDYFVKHDKEKLYASLMYFSIIISFILGAVCGNNAIHYFQEKAIMISSLFLGISFVLMRSPQYFFKTDKVLS